jgi:hypothetical protein
MRKAAATPAAKPAAKKPAAKAKAVHVVLEGEKWVILREGNKRPTAKFDTQQAAWEEALKIAKQEKTLAVKKGKDGSVKEQRNFGA